MDPKSLATTDMESNNKLPAHTSPVAISQSTPPASDPLHTPIKMNQAYEYQKKDIHNLHPSQHSTTTNNQQCINNKQAVTAASSKNQYYSAYSNNMQQKANVGSPQKYSQNHQASASNNTSIHIQGTQPNKKLPVSSVQTSTPKSRVVHTNGVNDLSDIKQEELKDYKETMVMDKLKSARNELKNIRLVGFK